MSIDASLATAVLSLKRLPAFRNVSLRLLADLAEVAGAAVEEIGPSFQRVEADLVVVVDGTVEVRTEGPHGATEHELLGPGSTYLFERARGRALLLRAVRPRQAHVLPILAENLEMTFRGSTTFRRSVDRTAFDLLGISSSVEGTADRPAVHAIWLCEEPGLQTPLAALVHLLAASLARDFGEPTVLGVFDDHLQLSVWDGERFVSAGVTLTGAPDAATIVEKVNAKTDRPNTFYHLLLVRPSDARRLPDGFKRLRFDRVICLTRNVPTRVAPALRDLLLAETSAGIEGGGPYFSSFIASVLLPARVPRRARALLPWLPWFIPQRAWLNGGRASKRLPTEPVAPVGGLRDGRAAAGVERRLRRDACRLRLPLDAIRDGWQAWPADGPRSFLDWLLARHPDDARAWSETFSRWGRAITNRQVGVALSGGGASSYRIVPLIETFAEKGVPIDVLSGVSGGALIGAYYCKAGLQGLEDYQALGPLLQVFVLLSMLDSSCIEWLIDRRLDGTAVDELERWFVPLTTALPRGQRPEARAITGGTLGEAVRASGAAPLLFSPTEKGGVRYCDGAAAAMVPSRVLPSFGADIVFAFNSIPGPAAGNPLSALPFIGDLLYRHTLAGRLVDALVTQAYLFEQTSRDAAGDADDFAEAEPQEVPLVESFMFWRGRAIAADAARDRRWKVDIDRCVARWAEFYPKQGRP